MDRLITANELAERWGISRASIYNLIHRGLPSVKIGRARRYDPTACDAWLTDEQVAS